MTQYEMSRTCQIANLAEIYAQYLGYCTEGTFVEVGAHDGYAWSNTWGLAQAGWTGLYVEPVKTLFEQCRMNHAQHPNVMVANCCVGDVTGTVKLYMAENPTIDTETVEKQPWCTYDADNFVLAPCYTLDALLDLFEVSAPIDVLVIDVEGAELKVLAGASMERWKPRMIIVETHDGNPVEAFSFHAKAIREWFADKPYKLVQCDGLNSIYWRVDQ